MPVFRDKSTGEGTFAGTMGAAMALHNKTHSTKEGKDKFKTEPDEGEGTNETKGKTHADVREHLGKAKEHLDKAAAMHGGMDQDDEAKEQGPGIMGGIKSALGDC